MGGEASTTIPATAPVPSPTASISPPVSGKSYLDSISSGSTAISGQGVASYLDKVATTRSPDSLGVASVTPPTSSSIPSSMTREERDRLIEAKVERQVEIIAERAAEQAAERAAEFGTEKEL